MNFKGALSLSRTIRGNWTGGEPTTPSDASIIYAPEGTVNVTARYYEDEVEKVDISSSFIGFVGPAVNQPVYGNAR